MTAEELHAELVRLEGEARAALLDAVRAHFGSPFTSAETRALVTTLHTWAQADKALQLDAAAVAAVLR
jgi:hypothetical protein